MFLDCYQVYNSVLTSTHLSLGGVNVKLFLSLDQIPNLRWPYYGVYKKVWAFLAAAATGVRYVRVYIHSYCCGAIFAFNTSRILQWPRHAVLSLHVIVLLCVSGSCARGVGALCVRT